MSNAQKTSSKKPAAAKAGKEAPESTAAEKMREALARVKAAKGAGKGGATPDGKRSNAASLKDSQVRTAQMTRRTQGKGG